MKNREDSYKIRLSVVFYAVLIFCMVITVRLLSVQVFNRAKYLEEVEAQLPNDYNIVPAERGEIFDRNGNLLAFSEPYYQLDVNPSILSEDDKEKLLKELPKVTGMQENVIRNLLKAKSYVLVSKSITLDGKNKIEALRIEDGVTLTRVYNRFYPYGKYFSHIVGFVGIDNVGLSGLEYEFEDILRGKNGRIFKNLVSTRPILPGVASYSVEPEKGKSIVLTLDTNIQYKAQVILEANVNKLKAKSGSIIVMNPTNGEILAMASCPLPTGDVSEQFDNVINRCIAWNYEPGSVVKPIIAAYALEKDMVPLDAEFECGGSIKVKDRVISCWKKHGKQEGLKEVLKNSCDVAFAKVSMIMGKENVLNCYKAFGFGSSLDVELPGEEKGILPDLQRIGEVETATMGFGQGIAATPLQVATAFATVINGGIEYKPTIIKEIRDNEGKTTYEAEPIIRNIVLSKETSQIMRDALLYTVNEGIKNAKIKGIEVIGKTGTAQKVENGSYSKSKLIYSFVGAFPASNPQVVVLIVIDETPNPMYSIDITPPVFKELAEFLIKYLRIGYEDS